jgi:hypothetical protein
MHAFEYHVALRAEILKIVSGVEDSHGSMFQWDETTPNWSTKSDLEKLLQRFLLEARNFGLFLVTRHCSCPNPKHDGYYISNDLGLKIKYGDTKWVWSGAQMYQGHRNCICPCSPKNQATKHWVIDDLVHERDKNPEMCKQLADILSDISYAIDSAADRKPRSGIREHLLRAVLNLNDQLLPEPMDLYIRNRIKAESR